ncbi:N-carbamoylsarcosine amidohydrolase [Leifsonia kafniensis]|uniref:N-carbamoylsarcosine amidohydrolase n=1 Tax=Leifsonia kafniensis TaxID=475957 RepID=A0ABP7K1X0_9MICO
MTEADVQGGFAAGFAGTLSPGRLPVLLSIDLMRAYFDPDSPLCLPSDSFLGVAAEVIAAARRESVPVIHTVVRYREGSADGGIFIDKVPALRALIGDSAVGATMPSVAPTADETVIVKQFASAFFGTDLAARLRATGVDTVVIIGTSTSGCVRATAVDAIQYGFVPLVVSDAVGDRDEAVHRASLYDLQAKYAEVIDSPTAIAYLRGVSR